jgi:hypothetical protein
MRFTEIEVWTTSSICTTRYKTDGEGNTIDSSLGGGAMKRFLATGLVFLWANVALISAQNAQPEPSPVPPSNNLVGPQLIAWSEMQKPQPVESMPASLPSQKPLKPRTASPNDSTANKPQPAAQSSAATRQSSDFSRK